MYTGIKPITSTYLVQITNDCVYYVEASRCTVDTEHGIILFYKNDSVQAMEDNLESLKNNTYAFYDGEHKNWYANNRTPTFEDFNRLESACLKLYNGFSRQEAMKHRLSFRLGQMSCIRI